MNQRRSFILLLAAALLLGAFVFSASAKGDVGAPVFQSPLPLPRSASVYLGNVSPNSVTIGQELTFDMGLSVSNINPGVAGADIYLGYNPAVVAPVLSSGQPNIELLSDFFGASNVSISGFLATCPVGSGQCLRIVVAGPAQMTKNGMVARFHFTAQASGQSCFTVLGVALSDADAYPVVPVVLPAAPTCHPVEARATITGRVLRQGTPANPNLGNGTLRCSEVRLSTGQSVYTDFSGNFSIANVLPGTYTIEAGYPGYFRATKAVVVESAAVTKDVGTVQLNGGDVDGDTKVNIQDILTILAAFGRTGLPVRSATFCSSPDNSIDINDDGTVNIGDLALAANNWNRYGVMIWR